MQTFASMEYFETIPSSQYQSNQFRGIVKNINSNTLTENVCCCAYCEIIIIMDMQNDHQFKNMLIKIFI